jgi:hypothetical protein
LVSGVGVCLPGAAGNRCAACTSASSCNAGLTCYLNRCYEPCNVNLATSCSTCVQTKAAGDGICGCDDQISGPNEACGVQPEVRACQAGTTCLAGLCRSQCDPLGADTCPAGTACRPLGNLSYCQEQVGAGGGPGSGGGTATGGGGGRSGGGAGGGSGGGGSVTSAGCGCSSADPGWLLLAPALFALRRRRAR